MSERINFSTEMLDLMKKYFMQTLGCEVALSIIPAASQNPSSTIASNAFLLAEETETDSFASMAWYPTTIYFDAFWMLGMRTDLPASISTNPPQNLSDFQKCLESLKADDNYKYPWFESLESPVTSFHLLQAIKSKSSNSEIEFLQKALDNKLLNPLSLEADENLAFEVLQCGDAYFSSMWVPENISAGNFTASASIKFIPFPGANGYSSIHRARLRLWSRFKEFSAVNTQKLSSTFLEFHKFYIIDCNIKTERLWVEHESSIFFRRLIAGEL